MKHIAELCKPRDSVFMDTTREDVLNLSDLVEGRIDGEKFFAENFRTKGMDTLFDVAFKRFKGESQTGVIKLTQAMGGGKTHNMLALALIAQNPELRAKILGHGYDNIGEIKVVAFTGRESDVPFGIWGAIADQLGKKDVFKDLYAPLKAPGEGAWINLLKGQKTLILLDELPPYLEYTRAISVGDSNLCNVTVTALSNLFSALGKEQLSNVCLVFSDLKATYESGSSLLQSSFKELEHEANRVALNIEPVALNSDEIYDILRTRLFEEIPAGNSIDVYDIAIAYQGALARSNKSGLTNQSTSTRFAGIKDSYPFHPSIKDLYARFKENPNFQQTRGLIRLMRQIVRQFYESKQAEKAYLINVFDIDLNSPKMLGFINEIKASLANAINHDIAQGGKAVAEDIDAGYGLKFPYAQNVSKLIFMASLNDVALGVNGLTKQEILGYLCEPDVDMDQYNKVFTDIEQQSWYLKMDNRGRYYFQNTKNMVAQMNTLVESYSNEKAKAELIKTLTTLFQPKLKSCYELLYVMPAVDEIKLDRDKISLVIFEPHGSVGLHPDLTEFYNNSIYKNRVMFLSGQKSLMDKLYENSKKKMAIEQLLREMAAEHVPTTDQQYIEAQAQKDSAVLALYSTIVNTFVTLYYPVKNGLNSDEIRLQFTGNKLNGEDQVIDVLRDASKYEEFSSDDMKLETMRKKCEARIFTQKEMPWSTILDRAATETAWQWYHPDQMKNLRDVCLKKDVWRDIGGYINKGPFAKEPTEVQVDMISYDRKTHEFTLKVRPIRGNTVYYEVGAEPSTASPKVDNPFVTKEIDLYFRCVDESADPHPTGDSLHYLCKAPLLHEIRGTSNGNVMELETHPKYEIRYTTDGSNPKESGGKYLSEFVIPPTCKFVQVAVYNNGNLIDEQTYPVDVKAQPQVKIDDVKPLEYVLKKPKRCGDTQETYAELDILHKIPNAFIRQCSITITDKNNSEEYLDISTAKVPYDAENLKATVDLIRETAFAKKDVIIEFEYRTLLFLTGKDFKNWMDMSKRDMNDVKKEGDIKQ